MAVVSEMFRSGTMVVVTTPSPFVSAAIDAALEAGKLLQRMLPESWASKGSGDETYPV